MRKFYYIKINTGKKLITKIYSIKNNRIVKLGEIDYVARGGVHDIFEYLIDIGEIPKKHSRSSESVNTGAGYFYGEVTKLYEIIDIS